MPQALLKPFREPACQWDRKEYKWFAIIKRGGSWPVFGVDARNFRPSGDVPA
jgi:hypothetical protein